MSKKLKIELFNIYDVVVFEDENGIAQDCVCAIGKDKEVDKEVDIIECNYHSISIYEDGNYKVWEKDGKNMPYYATSKKIIHLYTLKNDNRYYDIYPIDDYGIIDNTKSSEAVNCLEAFNRLMGESPEVHTESYNLVYNSLKRLEAIDNAKPSEALNCLELSEEIDKALEIVNSHLTVLEKEKYNVAELKQDFTSIKQVLLKANKQKKYLKWEDLEFKPYTMKVKMGNSIYMLDWHYSNDDDYDNWKSVTLRALNGDWLCTLDKFFFNDLRLEVDE